MADLKPLATIAAAMALSGLPWARNATISRIASCSASCGTKIARALRSAANDRRKLIGEVAGEERQIAGAVMLRAKPVADRRLSLGQRIKLQCRREYGGRLREVVKEGERAGTRHLA